MTIYHTIFVFVLMPKVITREFQPTHLISGTEFFSTIPQSPSSIQNYGSWISFHCMPDPSRELHRVWYFSEETFDGLKTSDLKRSSLKHELIVQPTNERYEDNDVLYVRYLSHFVGMYICRMVQRDGTYQEVIVHLQHHDSPENSPPRSYFDNSESKLFIMNCPDVKEKLRVDVMRVDKDTHGVKPSLRLHYASKDISSEKTCSRKKVEVFHFKNRTFENHWIMYYYKGVYSTDFMKMENIYLPVPSPTITSVSASEDSPTTLVVLFRHNPSDNSHNIPYEIVMKEEGRSQISHRRLFYKSDLINGKEFGESEQIWKAMFTGLEINTAYRASVSYNKESSSSVGGRTTAPSEPDPVPDVTISSITQSSIALNWQPTSSSEVLRYYVMFGDNESNLRRIPVTGNTFMQDGLTPNKFYQVHIGVEGALGASKTLAKFHFRTADNARERLIEQLRLDLKTRTDELNTVYSNRDSIITKQSAIADDIREMERKWHAMAKKQSIIQDIEEDVKQIWNETFEDPDSFTQVFFIIVATIAVIGLFILVILKKNSAQLIPPVPSKSSTRSGSAQKSMEASSSASKSTVLELATKSASSSTSTLPKTTEGDTVHS